MVCVVSVEAMFPHIQRFQRHQDTSFCPQTATFILWALCFRHTSAVLSSATDIHHFFTHSCSTHKFPPKWNTITLCNIILSIRKESTLSKPGNFPFGCLRHWRYPKMQEDPFFGVPFYFFEGMSLWIFLCKSVLVYHIVQNKLFQNSFWCSYLQEQHDDNIFYPSIRVIGYSANYMTQYQIITACSLAWLKEWPELEFGCLNCIKLN